MFNRLRHLAPPVVLCAMAAGCSTDPGPAGATLPTLSLVEDLRLDPEIEDFSTVNRVVAGPGGRFAVLLHQDRQVRVYDSLGRLDHTVGRSGSGPGELQGIGGVNWRADTLFVADHHQTRRIHFFGPRGHLLRTTMLPEAWPDPANLNTDSTGIGLYYFSGEIAGPGEAIIGGATALSTAWQDGSRSEAVVARLATSGQLTRVGTVASLAEQAAAYVWIEGFGRAVPFVLSPRVAYAHDGSRVAIMKTDQSSDEPVAIVTVIRASGDTIYSVRYPLAGDPVTPAEADSAVAAMGPPPGSPARLEGPPVEPFQRAARAKVPRSHSPVEAIVLGLDGGAWITLRPTPDGHDILAVDSLGNARALMRIPPRSRLRAASASHLWFTELSEDDLASVVRYRIAGP